MVAGKRKIGMPRQKTKKTLIKILLERRLVETEAIGRSLIMAGKVLVNDQRCDKAGEVFDAKVNIRIKNENGGYVSRGALKLKGAIAELGLDRDFLGATVVDAGSSTGGFTEVVLEKGAAKVHAIEIGSNQLAWSLRSHPAVFLQENTDIRSLGKGFDNKVTWIVGDLSFISLGLILPHLANLSEHEDLRLLLLIKPQFELSEKEVPEGGIVEDDKLRQKAVDQVTTTAAGCGLKLITTCESAVSGRYGNREIFALFQKA